MSNKADLLAAANDRIAQAQTRVVRLVDAERMLLYWDLGQLVYQPTKTTQAII